MTWRMNFLSCLLLWTVHVNRSLPEVKKISTVPISSTNLPCRVMSWPADSEPSSPPMQKMETVKDQMSETCHCSRCTSYLCRHVRFTSSLMYYANQANIPLLQLKKIYLRKGFHRDVGMFSQQKVRSSLTHRIHTGRFRRCLPQRWQQLSLDTPAADKQREDVS